MDARMMKTASGRRRSPDDADLSAYDATSTGLAARVRHSE
jgi:hypothetical protein